MIVSIVFVLMSENKENKQVKKRQRRSSKQQKVKQRSDLAIMASTATTTTTLTSGKNNTSGTVPTGFPVSNFFNIPPSFPNYQPTITSCQPTISQQPNDISAQINFILSKVSKLDSIGNAQANILSRLSSIEISVPENKRMIQDTNKQIADIEKTQNFLSNEFKVNKHELSKVQAEVKILSKENKQLKTNNHSLIDDISDLKCRSMRDDMIFLGIPEMPISMETADYEDNQVNGTQQSPGAHVYSGRCYRRGLYRQNL